MCIVCYCSSFKFLFCFECSLGWLELIGFIGEFKFQEIPSRWERMRAYPMQSKLLHLKGIEKLHRSGVITIKFILICSPCVFIHLDKLQQQKQKCKDTCKNHWTEVVNRKRGNRALHSDLQNSRVRKKTMTYLIIAQGTNLLQSKLHIK